MTFLFLLLGLVVGSFLNVCIYRLPRRESLSWPASHCTTCNRPLSWYENIPLVSWLVLRGRCRTCRTRISAVYPIVEALTGLVFVAAYWAYGPTPLLGVRLAFSCAMIVLFFIDLEHQILPNAITIPGAALGLVSSIFLPPGLMNALIAAVIGGVFPWAVAEAYLRLRGREGMGFGDFKMLAMVGAFLGWPMVYIVLMLACVSGVVIGSTALLMARKSVGDTRIPFGTFIAVAAVAAVLLEPQLQSSLARLYGDYVDWAVGGA